MADPLIVLLLVAATDAKDATTFGMTAAARRALEPTGVVLVDARPELPSDAEALALADRVHARGVVELMWADEQHRRARLHLHLASDTDWLDREIDFLPEDAPAERGRTLGLALATMLAEHAAPAEHVDVPPPSEPPPSTSVEDAPRAIPATTGEPPPLRVAAKVRRAALDLVGAGAVGLGGEAAGVGPSLSGRWLATDSLAARVAAGARFGALPAADASTLTVVFAAGGAVRLAAAGDVEIGVRGDVLLTRFAARREQAGATLERSRWIGGADLLAEATWTAAPSTALVTAAGAEVAFGPTDVALGGVQVTRVPLARLVAEAGARVRF